MKSRKKFYLSRKFVSFCKYNRKIFVFTTGPLEYVFLCSGIRSSSTVGLSTKKLESSLSDWQESFLRPGSLPSSPATANRSSGEWWGWGHSATDQRVSWGQGLYQARQPQPTGAQVSGGVEVAQQLTREFPEARISTKLASHSQQELRWVGGWGHSATGKRVSWGQDLCQACQPQPTGAQVSGGVEVTHGLRVSWGQDLYQKARQPQPTGAQVSGGVEFTQRLAREFPKARVSTKLASHCQKWSSGQREDAFISSSESLMEND